MSLFKNILPLLFFPCFLYGQENHTETIERLQKEVSRIEEDIKNKSDTLKKLQNEIYKIENQHFISNLKSNEEGLYFPAVIRMSGKIRKSSDPFSDIITFVDKSDTVFLYDYNNNYWAVRRGGHIGYLSELYLLETNELKVLKSEFVKRTLGVTNLPIAKKSKYTSSNPNNVLTPSSGGSYMNSSKSYNSSSSSSTIHTGPRGGKYYINSNGNKTYLKSNKSTGASYRSRSTYRSYRRK